MDAQFKYIFFLLDTFYCGASETLNLCKSRNMVAKAIWLPDEQKKFIYLRKISRGVASTKVKTMEKNLPHGSCLQLTRTHAGQSEN